MKMLRIEHGRHQYNLVVSEIAAIILKRPMKHDATTEIITIVLVSGYRIDIKQPSPKLYEFAKTWRPSGEWLIINDGRTTIWE